MPKLNLTRYTLGKFLPDHESIVAFERMLVDVGETLPTTIEEANALAGQALAAAQAALSALSVLADALALFEGEPAPLPVVDPDDTAPSHQLGTLSAQNHDAIEVTGGTLNGTAIGAITPSTARVTTLQTDQLHTVTKGSKFSGPATLSTALASTISYEHPHTRYYIGDGTGYSFRFSKRAASVTTDVAIITDQGAVSFAAGFGCNGKAAQPSVALGAAATDPATTQTLVNTIRTALIANGIGA